MSHTKTAMKCLRVRIAMIHPLSITLGGFEHQAIQTCHALRSLGVDARLMDWNKADDEFDILHLFGASSSWDELSAAAAGECRIVVTALGAADPWKRAFIRCRGDVSVRIGRLLGQKTDYGRIYNTLHRAASVMCLNADQREFYRSAYGVPSSKITVVPNGVPASRYDGGAAAFEKCYGVRDYVLFTGNIVSRKRPLQLARVLKRRGRTGVFIGGTLNSADEMAYAQAFEAEIKDTPNLLWVRGLAYDDPLLDSAYAGARAFCLPSVSESQPLSAMEAMAAGTPVILADRPYAFQPPFEHAVRFRSDDERSLELALEMVLGSPEQYRHVLPPSYSWPDVARETLKVYQRIMDAEPA